MRILVSLLLLSFLAAASDARAQLPDPGRLLRAASDGGFAPRWPRRPLLDAATEAAGIIAVRNTTGLDGTGASVCVVDTGVDLSHRDFRDTHGATRVRWLFDFESPPRGIHTALEEMFDCAVWRGDELDASEDVPRDTNGHGTAVAAVAVGDDADVGEDPGPLAGAAPKASLIVVKLPLEEGLGFSDSRIALGTQACFAVDDPDRTVAVLSFGGHDGRHDGSEPLDLALDALAASGARIVVAAGNDGDAPIHATGSLGARAAVPLELAVPRPETADDTRFVSIAITAISSARLTVTAPDGTRVGPIGLGSRDEATGPDAHVLVDGTLATDPRSGTLYVILGNGETGTFGGDYELALETSGRFDAWIVDYDLGNTLLGPRFRGPFVEESGTVTVPGTAEGVLTVGASITYTHRDTEIGEVRIDGESGDVAAFSAVGPPPGGRAKPDLVAPGALVVTALSSDAVDGDPGNLFRGAADRIARQRVAPDRVAVSGTSFTAPLAAGVIALGLGASSDALDFERIRYAARPVGEPWDPHAGFGHLDAEAFISGDAGPVGAFLVTTAPVDSASPSLVVAGRVTTADGPYTGPVDLYLTGERMDTVQARAGVVHDHVSLPTLFAGESVTLEARVQGVVAGELVVVGRIDGARDRSPPSARGGGGGCSATEADSGSTLLLLALLFLSRGRRPRSCAARRPGASQPRCRERRAPP